MINNAYIFSLCSIFWWFFRREFVITVSVNRILWVGMLLTLLSFLFWSTNFSWFLPPISSYVEKLLNGEWLEPEFIHFSEIPGESSLCSFALEQDSLFCSVLSLFVEAEWFCWASDSSLLMIFTSSCSCAYRHSLLSVINFLK